jgi:hypothetical protein
MTSLISLELRKQRKTFLGIMLIIVMCLTVVTASISAFADVRIDQGYLLITAVLQGFGLPFFALLLGCTAGAALKSSERKAEEDLPVRPSKRMFAAYIASLSYLLMLIAILFVLTVPIKNSDLLQADFMVETMMALLLPLHCAAFVFSYWISQPLLGGIVSTIITVPSYLFFPFRLFDGFYYTRSNSAFPGFIAIGIQILLMFWLANRIEREKRTRLPVKIAIGAIIVCSIVLSVTAIALLGSVYEQIFDTPRGCYCN